MSLNKRLIAVGPPPETATFNIVTYSGNDSTQSITGVGFQPDAVWIKPRNQVENHTFHDSTRGSTNQFAPNGNANYREQSNTITSFDSDGFTTGNDNNTNKSGINYVAWCWKANGGTTSSNTDGSITSSVQVSSDQGFSIAQFTGTQNNASVGHGLGGAAEFVFTKGSQGIPAMHMGDGTNKYWGYRLNETGLDTGNGAGFFQNFTPNSTIFKVGASDESNKSSTVTYAYSFRSISGVSKFGYYTSNAGTKITTGFEPKFMMFKYANGGDWYMQDLVRYAGATGGNGGKLIKLYLVANTTAAEASVSTGGVEVMSDGFYPTNWFDTTNGVVYMAWA